MPGGTHVRSLEVFMSTFGDYVIPVLEMGTLRLRSNLLRMLQPQSCWAEVTTAVRKALGELGEAAQMCQ